MSVTKFNKTEIQSIAQHIVNAAIERYRKEVMPAPEYLNTKQAAAYLSLSTQRLEIWRVQGGGPPYHKLCHAVRYKKSELDAFMASNSRNHTAEGGENV